MLRNYFKTAWRNLIRNKFLSFIKIISLSIGLSACMLIFLYTKDELSYDQFHENKERLYRIIQTIQEGDNPPHTIGVTNSSLGEAVTKEIPEIQQFVRIYGESLTIKNNNDIFTESALFVDANFFNVFTFPLIEGNKKTALQDPQSVVISVKLSKKYFGAEDPVGKVMLIKRRDAFENFTVTALAENPPQNSSIKADIFSPIGYGGQVRGNPWLGGSLNTFLLVSPQSNVDAVEEKIQALFDKNTREFIAKAEKEQGIIFKDRLSLQFLTAIHLSKETGPANGMTDGSNPAWSYILTCIAIFILIIGSINFTNLAVAQSLKRGKEVGIRKVAGVAPKQLLTQFLTESFLISLIAFVIAIILTMEILPLFNDLSNKNLNFSYLSDWYLFAGYFLLLVITSFISGIYPSMVMSSFKPVDVLFGRRKFTSKNYLTKGLIMIQFSLAIILTIGTIVVYTQLNFLLHTDLGFDNKNLVRITLPSGNQGDKLASVFKNELVNQPEIINVAVRNRGRSITGIKANEKIIRIEYNRIDDRFLPTFKIPIITGRNFSPNYPSDSTRSAIVNESFIKEAGWDLKDAIGQTVFDMEGDNKEYIIVGVIKDYHFASLKEKITPELLLMDDALFSYGELWAKIDPNQITEALDLLQVTYKKLAPNHPYAYQFIDDINSKNYETEANWKRIIAISTGLFIFISCIGLLGLSMISVEHRTKEIGIRKVTGAPISAIITLISREFLVLITISFIIAVPVGYYFTGKWLQDFAYRIKIGWWIFVIAGLAVIGIAIITISFKAFKIAIANPVGSLRTE